MPRKMQANPKAAVIYSLIFAGFRVTNSIQNSRIQTIFSRYRFLVCHSLSR